MSQVAMEINVKEKQVRQLLKLQELFHCHYLTEELLNQMVSLYVKFVQNVPSNQHPLRVFFMEKIRFVLSRTEVIKILQKQQNENVQNIRNTIREMHTSMQFEQLAMKRLAEQSKAEIRQNHKINLKKERNVNENTSLKDKERNMKIEMQMKIMEEMQTNMKEFRQDLHSNEGKMQKKNAKINNIVNEQDQVLNKRLANRKKKLRKNSANLNEKEVIVVETAQPIPKQQLIAVQKELNQTYERFTRLTQNKNNLNSNGKENKGRVKMNMYQEAEEEELNFQVKKPEAKKEDLAINFSKKKGDSPKVALQAPIAEVSEVPRAQNSRGTETTTIEYKTFEQMNKGRVTKNFKLYEQIEQEQVF